MRARWSRAFCRVADHYAGCSSGHTLNMRIGTSLHVLCKTHDGSFAHVGPALAQFVACRSMQRVLRPSGPRTSVRVLRPLGPVIFCFALLCNVHTTRHSFSHARCAALRLLRSIRYTLQSKYPQVQCVRCISLPCGYLLPVRVACSHLCVALVRRLARASAVSGHMAHLAAVVAGARRKSGPRLPGRGFAC